VSEFPTSLRIDPKVPLDLSVITSWWAPQVVLGKKPKENPPPILPSIEETLRAGIPRVDYYYFPLGELPRWRALLGIPEHTQHQVKEIHRRLVLSPRTMRGAPAHYDISRRLRMHFTHARVASTTGGINAIATNASDIAQRVCTAKELLGLDAPLAVPCLGHPDTDCCQRERSGECPEKGGSVCGIYAVAAALRLASIAGARVVEAVGGPAGRVNHVDGDASCGPLYDFMDVVQEECKQAGAARPRADHADPLEDELVWSRRVASNLFVLANYILRQLPPTDEPHRCPPVSLALEIEPGAVFWLNSISHYDSVINSYRRVVQRYMASLTERDVQRFKGFEDCRSPIDSATTSQLTEVFYRCVGLNVDVGHMFLTRTHPCQVAPLCGLVDDPKPDLCPDGLGGSRNCQWLDGDESAWRRRAESVLHYHLSDQHLLHYGDLPPGERHARAEFAPWLRQAYALAQLVETPGKVAAHPNYTACLALELEASPKGVDQVVMAYHQTRRWIQDIMEHGI